MTDNFPLDWAGLAVSFFNIILALWLGLTILLNAEQRRWGIWLASGGLLLGAVFFISHSVILGNGLRNLSANTDFWWHVGWLPVASAPYVWYVVMLWYADFWNDGHSRLHHRHRVGFDVATILLLSLYALLLLANPFPSYVQVAEYAPSDTPTLLGIPLLVILFGLDIILCIVLSLDALLHPELSERMMGELARQRARPWLVAASLLLLLVTTLVAAMVVWLVLNAPSRTPLMTLETNVLVLDLFIESLIGAVIVVLGQAIVTYEIFTGRTLPRRGLFRQWRVAVILSAGFSAVMSWSLRAQLPPLYLLILALLIVAVFYALLSWRTFNDRERSIARLRPFVASQRVFDSILSPSEVDVSTLLRALCEDILNARQANLVAVGPLASLFGSPLVYPKRSPPNVSLGDLLSRFTSPQLMCLALDPTRFNGAVWAVPLWSERGLIGVLLLGEKQDGGLYAQEEIEIARASGERLIDTQASAEMAKRLIMLQRQRLAESQIVDRRTRRALHDEVLPRIHAAMLKLASAEAKDEILALLTATHRDISNLLHEMPATTAPEIGRWGLIGALKRTIDREFANAFDDVIFQVDEGAVRFARTISPINAEVIFYASREAIRNAARHGRSSDNEHALHLCVNVTARDGFQIAIEDDGVGVNSARGTDGGSGEGLTLHSTMMAVIGGSLAIESEREKYTRVVLVLPNL